MKEYLKRHMGLIILLIILLVFPASLSNQAKLNMRIIVTGLGIDKNDDGYDVTAQIVRTSSGTESPGTSAEIEFIKENAPTISKALSNLMYKAGKISAFSHTNFIILGNGVLDEDVTMCLDLFLRDKVIKNSALILFSEKSAEEEIKKTKNLELSVGLGLQKVFTYKQEESEGLMMTILDFINKNNMYGKTSLASVFSLEENQVGKNSESSQSNNSSINESGQSGSSSSSSSNSSETTTSKNNKYNFKANAPLMCFVNGNYTYKLDDEKDIFGYLILNNKTKTSYIIIDNIKNEDLKDTKVTILINDKKVIKKVRYENEIPCLDINVKILNSEIDEIISKNHFTNLTSEQFLDIKENIKEYISDCISGIFEKMKQKNADIFEAYEMAYKFNYNDTMKYYKNEKDFIENLKINVNVDIFKIDN